LKNHHKLKSSLVLITFWVVLSNQLNAQELENAKSKILYAEGSFTFNTNEFDDGLGLIGGVGYHTNLDSSGRIRFSPRLNLGTFSGFDAPFTSHSLLAGFDGDLIRIKSFSIVIGAGSGFNLTSSYADDPIHDFNFVFNINFGIRFYRPEWKTGFELAPIDFLIDPYQNGNEFGEVRIIKVRIIINEVKF